MNPSNQDLNNALAGRPDRNDFLIVGLGASAGGVQALKEFFEQVPAATGMAYVVILHLSPDYDSKLAEVIRAIANIPVIKVTEKVTVEPDHIYVVPPNRHLTMLDGHILVSDNTGEEERRAPVDIFFRTLAESHGPRAVCVVLSGTGANGSMGLKRVKENGGATFVQVPREAEFNEMPRNAIATELVDDVLPVAAIPAKIIAYKESLDTVQITVEADKRPEAQQQALREIFSQLRLRTGQDFSNYKRPTLLRRIERRVNVRNMPDLSTYVAYLQNNPDETTSLLKDLLIWVTNFFRDRKAFETIENDILPRLIEHKHAEEQLRIWVAGCATGEEAYSLAMLCAEKTLGVIDAPKVQIFATDIDEAAIAHAREGIYTLNDAADVSPERLRKFFMRDGDGYRVRREIREMILFANHNFIKDPPFSHLDLVSCRNVLIYLNHSAQERVMETFHFALNPGGYLFLGSSESATGANDLYTLYNREHHIFQSRQLTAHAYPVPESVPTFQFKQPNIPANISEQEHRTLERITISDLHQRLLEQYAPPSLVINEEYEIVHLSERVGRYLQIAGGEPSQNLLKLIRPELRLELRSALYQSLQRQTPVEARGLKVSVNEHTESINIHVRPVFRPEDPAKGFILVLFERASDEEVVNEVVLSSDEPVARQLEEELMRVKVQLRAAIEQHEFHAEELKASNEELQAMNEELRSAAEELETSKEELQSINEELRTVNQELKVKIEETTLANNNLQNLIKSVDIGTIFLDRSFRVALFTPSIRVLFNLIPNDIGRPLSDITHRLVYNNLMEDAELVQEKLRTIEHEVSTTDGRLMMMRVLPYRTSEDRINGVVITFFDITERKLAEEALRQSEERYRTLFNSIDEAFALCEILTDSERKTVDYRIQEVNPAFEKIMGFMPDHAYGKNTWEVVSGPESSWIKICEKAAINGETFRFESRIAETGRWFDTFAGPVGEKGNGKFALVFTDISERKRNELSIRENEARLAAIFAEAKVGLSEISLEGKFLQVNNILCRILERSREELLTLTIKDVTYPEDLASTQDAVKRLIASEAPVSLDKRYKRRDGTPVWVNSTLSLLKMDDHNPPVILAVSQDLTERKKAEAALLESEKKLATELRNMQYLQQVSSQMILEDNGDVLYNHLLDALMSIMHADMGSIHLLNLEKQGLYLLVHTGFDKAAAKDLEWIPANTDSIYSWTLNKKNRVTVNNPAGAESSLPKKERSTYEHLGIQIIQSTPLITRNGKVLGVITCYWKNSQALPQSEMHIVDVLARQAADLVERKLAEQALRHSEELFRAIVSQTTVGIYRATLEGELLFVNRTFCEILGYTEAQLLGITTWSLTHADDLEMNRQVFKRLLEENAPFEIEKRLFRKDGSVMWASVSAAPIRDHEGSVRYIVAVVLDITERKALEQQREDFISIASHELKTPVTSIKAYVEVLQELFEESKDLQNAELMKKLDLQVDRLTELINVLLDTTNVAEGKLVLHPEKFDMNRLIAEHIGDLQHLSKMHRFVFRRGKLQPVIADKEHIGQVLTNLFSNAIKYSPAGGDIIVTSEEVDNSIRIHVQDSGIGIPEASLNKVFNRFFRVTGTNGHPTPPGMGLGLYITAGIIQRHGGTIHVTSEPGKGSTFHITLPYVNKNPA